MIWEEEYDIREHDENKYLVMHPTKPSPNKGIACAHRGYRLRPTKASLAPNEGIASAQRGYHQRPTRVQIHWQEASGPDAGNLGMQERQKAKGEKGKQRKARKAKSERRERQKAKGDVQLEGDRYRWRTTNIASGSRTNNKYCQWLANGQYCRWLANEQYRQWLANEPSLRRRETAWEDVEWWKIDLLEKNRPRDIPVLLSSERTKSMGGTNGAVDSLQKLWRTPVGKELELRPRVCTLYLMVCTVYLMVLEDKKGSERGQFDVGGGAVK
ncbi:hypothetical protein C8J56DRAFT_1029102 [Mycena floridula]|nr:hypothetical protein C8J56DRAFT_1029102 [Mycena floridula]